MIDIPIFLTASVSVAVFYICAQRELNPRTWMREMLLLPCLLALGVGLSINNARAVLEGLFGVQSEFVRTPKHGIRGKLESWSSKKYRAAKSITPFIELGMSAYFAVAIVSAEPMTTGATPRYASTRAVAGSAPRRRPSW